MLKQTDNAAEQETGLPLVLDIDGTLLRTDLLYETFWAALGHNLAATFWVLLTCWHSPARLKRRLLRVARPDIDLLPVREEVLDMAREAMARGRPVHLASAADQSLVDAVARRFGLPGPHFGSGDGVNLKGAAKARLLVREFGPQGYEYVGDSAADLAVWENAERGVAINARGRLASRLAALAPPIRRLTEKPDPKALLKELRPHQWIKNLLLFLPLLAAHDLRPGTVIPVVVAIVAFSIGASAIYIVNDLLDLSADRGHPEKRNRPVASGDLPIPMAMLASVRLSVVALLLAYLVSPGVAALTLAYMIGSLSYSLWFKKRRWVDLLALASLFLLRVLTGAVAAQTTVPVLIMALVFTAFFTLACVKRMTELARAIKRGHLPGRAYGQRHFRALEVAGYLGVVLSTALFIGYAYSASAASQYSLPHLLALAAFPVAIWLGRVVRLSAKGVEDYDPVVFVTHDRIGLAIAAVGVLMALLAI